VLTEPAQAAQESIELAGGDEYVAPAEGREHLLTDTTLVTVGANELEILVGVIVSDTTLQSDKHERSIQNAARRSTDLERGGFDCWHYTLCAGKRASAEQRAFL